MSYYTELGKKCKSMVGKYRSLWKYYDSMCGSIIVSLDIYNSDKRVSESIFELLKEPRFLDDKGVEHNWALEIGYWDMGEGDKDYVVIRAIESYC